MHFMIAVPVVMILAAIVVFLFAPCKPFIGGYTSDGCDRTYPTPTPYPTLPPGAHLQELEIRNFIHKSVEIEVGDLIVWTNYDQPLHTASHVPDTTTAEVEFNSGNITPQSSFRHQFNTVGTYYYLCLIHPIHMNGVITVREKTN